jgi:flagellar basal body-associated protein FliL
VKMKNSRKMMQLKLSVLTRHDIFAKLRVRNHDQALRSIFTERMLEITENDIAEPNFRQALRTDFKTKANELIRSYEGYDFDLVADVLITSYVVE